MEFTGERFVPLVQGEIKYEHLHRYALSLEFAADKSVLDVASGEGYGAAMLARVARSVTGVDLDPETVRHARHNYHFSNLNFLVGGCDELPVPDASVDLVTSFETIEHHDLHEEMMREVKRVLRPGGILIISSPNRLVYSDERNYTNPFHVKELYYDEFRELLGRHFKHQRMYGQRLAAGSFVLPLQGAGEDALRAYSGDPEHLSQQMRPLPAPVYFVAICSDAVLPERPTISSLYVDAKDDLLKQFEVEKLGLFEELQKTRDAASEREQSFEAQIEGIKEELSRARAGYGGQIERMTDELSGARKGYEDQIEKLLGELAEARARYEKQIQTQAEELTQARVKYEEQFKDHFEELSLAREQIAEYQAQISRQAEELSQARAGYEAQIESLKEELTRAREGYEGQIERMAGELSGAREGYGREIKKLTGELAQARAEGEAMLAQGAEELAAARARASELESQITELESQITEFEGQTAEFEGQTAELKMQTAELKTQTAEFERQTAELERQTAELQTQVEQRAAAYAEIQSHLMQRNAAIVEVHSQLLSKDEVLNWIQTSRSWKAITSLRYLYYRSGSSVNNVLRRLKLPARDTFKGAIETPAPDANCSRYIDVSGWIATAGGRVTLVEAFLDGFFLGAVRYSSERPDIASTLPSRAWKVYGYAERLTLYNSFAGQRTLTLRAFDQHGHSHHFERQVIVTYSPESMQESAQGIVAPLVMEPPAPEPSTADSAGAERPAPAPVPAEVVKREEDVKADFVAQMEEVVGKFENRMNRAPFILNWNTGLELSEAFPHLAIMSPCASNGNGHLSYLDHSVDIVILPSRSGDRLAEARRVAAAAVVHVEGLVSGRKKQLNPSKEKSRLKLRAEWRDEEGLEAAPPETSIIIPVYNKVEYTRNCLTQLLNTLPLNFRGEIIVIDDASTDETPAVIEEFTRQDARIKSLRNEQNAGFIRSCNRAAEAANGEVIIFLNNDTLPQPGWLPPLLKVLQDYPDAGAVGGKLLYPDGTLQEAGGVIFSDASGCNFGKHDKAASAPLYSFLREVDYCSGALLATRRELFMKLGGFDTLYAPAYYEDTDYCFSLREKGYRVYYQPESVIIHFEGVTSGTDVGSGVKKYQEVNCAKFQAKWKHFLKHHPPPPRQYDFMTLHELSVRSWPRVNHEN